MSGALLGMALVGFFAGWVCADALRPRRRLPRRTVEPSQVRREARDGREASGS
jgi:hypothetical protein